MVTIYTSNNSLPEKNYAFHVLLREILGIEFQMVPENHERHHRLCLPNGGELWVENHFEGKHLPIPSPDQVQLVPHPFDPGQNIVSFYEIPDLILDNQRIVCSIDVFSAAFFMLTRIEEGKPEALDKHGRFPAEKSLAFQADFLHRPVVNEWADLLWDMLLRLGWNQPRPPRNYRLSVSCDVDHPKLWWSKTARLRTLGGAIFKRGDWKEALYFAENHLFSKKDPYDVFDEWFDILGKNNHVAQFNFLGSRPKTSDCWYPLGHPFVKNLMEKIAFRRHRIGFHPSYETFENQAVFDRELASLQAVSPLEITSGRQHYLRFAAPDTWRLWQEAGLVSDSTLGYPEVEGFRCGICHDFPVFDTIARKMLPLREQPLIAMDVTLAQYRGYTPEQGAEKLDLLQKEVKKHGGDFTVLWHNSSWNTPFWEPWKKVFLGVLSAILFAPILALAQSTSLPLQSQANHLIDRIEIQHPNVSPIHTDLHGYWRGDAANLALVLDTALIALSGRDRADLQYLADENNEWIPDSSRLLRHSRKPFGKVLYKTPANLFEINSKNFNLRVNPMLQFNFGKEAGKDGALLMNQFGLELRGDVAHKLFFYTNMVKTQARLPEYVTDRVHQFHAIPGAGFFKNYASRLFDTQNGYDYNVATAYFGIQVSRHISVQLGRGQQAIGNGYRSMLLSDFAGSANFLKISTRVWRFHYQNMFLELSPVSRVEFPGGVIYSKKYAAVHYLGYKITPKLSAGLFEATVLHRSRQFEFQYLNPVVFYRTVEGMIGSPDNVLIGLNTHYNLLKNIQLYGQFLLDEFTFKEFFSHSGWWANKYSVQIGAKYINAFGIDHLDFQAEYNSAQPYTYSHNDPYDSYTHYNQPLAHPLGANFREYIGIARYQPCSRVFLTARIIHAKTGDDTAAENWGGNPLLSYNTRVNDYGNAIGQGVGAAMNLFGFDASWMFRHNMFLDVKLLWRQKDSVEDSRDQTTKLLSAGFRLNIWNQNPDF